MEIKYIIEKQERFADGLFRVSRGAKGWGLSDSTGVLPLVLGDVETLDGAAYYPVEGQRVWATALLDFDRSTGQIRGMVARVYPYSERESALPSLSRGTLPPRPDRVVALEQLIQSLTNDSLRNFCVDLFSDGDLALKYVTVPASRQHHHSQPGGLLSHSLEMAEQALSGKLPLTLSVAERELVAVAALVHDIGKTVTTDNPPSLLQGQHHEFAGVPVISDAWKRLKAKWAAGADALLAILAEVALPKNRYGNRMSMALSLLDRLSAFGDAEAQAFQGKPGRWRFASLGGRDRFWRLPEPSNA